MIDNNNFKNMPVSRFRVIGIKMEPCSDDTQECDVKRMQKALYGCNKWFYFYKGFNISKNYRSCNISEDAFADAQVYNSKQLTISVSAIVGKNGTGKSTIVDMMIRLLNNLSAAILSEEDVYPAAAHLHFIDAVYASLAVYIDDKIRIITCKGHDITITKLEKKANSKSYTFDDEINILRLDGKPNTEKPILERDIDEDLRDELSDLFYTAVYNYSLYAFNYRDYTSEKTPKERLNTLGTLVKNEEDKYWLKGVFWKNDGYQTPIVLNPMREDGMLKVQKENKLAKDRLFSLLFYQDENKQFPFRVINEKLEIVGITLKRDPTKTYDENFILSELEIGIDDYIGKFFKDKYDLILSYWSEKYNFDKDEAKLYDTPTCNYIVYKTLKISINYKKYENLYSWLESPDKNEDFVRMCLDQLNSDDSHITMKLRRALNFMQCFQKFESYKLGRKKLSDLCDEYDQLQELYTIVDDDGTIMDFKTKEELLPPPTIDFDFDIVPIDKIVLNDGCHDYDELDIIPFEGLSAGERQIAYTVSNVMYHLVNIDSVWFDFNTEHKEHARGFKYSYVNILFDELELYFHPELQRLFVTYILNAISSASLYNIKGVNILMVTHSPFVISDLPDSNVLFLTKDGKPSIGKTFGANIYEMLNDHFFLGQPIGEKAVAELKEIITFYNNSKKSRKKYYLENRERYRYISSIIGDEYLQKQIDRMLEKLDEKYGLVDLDKKLKEYEQKVLELRRKLGV